MPVLVEVADRDADRRGSDDKLRAGPEAPAAETGKTAIVLTIWLAAIRSGGHRHSRRGDQRSQDVGQGPPMLRKFPTPSPRRTTIA